MVSTSRILEIYHAVRLTYKSKRYSYFKYNGKIGKAYDGESSKHYSAILRVQKRFDSEERVAAHFAFNFLSENLWITGIAEERALRITSEFEKRTASIDVYFRQDLETLKDKYSGATGFKKLVSETEFNAPLFSLLLGGKIHFTTFIFLNCVGNYSSHWKGRVWKSYEHKISVTEQFMRIDIETKRKVAKLIKEVLVLNNCE